MLFVGTQTNDPNKRIEIDFDGLLHHTLIVGQSGSGKSFLVARIIEEILIRSKARVLIIDPNGDFRRISTPSESVWGKYSETFQKLSALVKNSGIINFDEPESFRPAWRKRRFIYLSPLRSAQSTRGDAANHRLLVHWDMLDADQRSFLLNANSSSEPRVFLGLKAVAENARWVSQNRPDVGIRFDLRGLLEVAKQFAESNLGLRDYEYAKILTRDDWYAVQAKIDDLISQYSIWWSAQERGAARPPGLADFIDGVFEGVPTMLTYWDALILSLEAAPPADSLLSADVALSRLWLRTKSEWRRRAEILQNDESIVDNRVPTFIIVDEAHNFAPDQSADQLRTRVTSRLMQIASEGRKYGLYLILASQRPTKLHRELVAECENACVLRLQSKIETDFANKVLGLSEAEAHAVPSFTKGQGVFVGRWVGGTTQMNTKIAPARIVVGGGEIGGGWKAVPQAMPELETEVSAVAEFVEAFLRRSEKAVELARLAVEIRDKFGEHKTSHWYGFDGFKLLLRGLDINNLAMSSVPPGFAYIDGLHEPPVMVPSQLSVEAIDLDPSIEAAVSIVKDQLSIPRLPKASYRHLFEVISKEVQENEFNITDTSKSIRDRCARDGVHVSRATVNCVLRGIYLSGHKYDSDISQSPEDLADAFVRSIVYLLKKNQVQIDHHLLSLLRDYYSGGILAPVMEPPIQTPLSLTRPPPNVANQEPAQSLADVPLAPSAE